MACVRILVRNYGCDLAFSPMIVADSFYNSPVSSLVLIVLLVDGNSCTIAYFVIVDGNSEHSAYVGRKLFVEEETVTK